jgi:natural resistance-associated macrophage protein
MERAPLLSSPSSPTSHTLKDTVDRSVFDDSAQHIKSGTIEILEEDDDDRFSWRKFWTFSGPGWLMSIAYLDPGNLESDLQAGAQAGYSLLWVLWWSTFIGMFLQLLSARLGVSTGMNLAQICRVQYSPLVRYILWVMMEIAIVSSDIQEVIGSALAISILSDKKIPLYGGVLITGIDTFTFLLLERYGLRKLEALFAVLITTMAITFGYMFYAIQSDGDLNIGDIVEGTVVPGIPDGTGEQAIGILGAVIMPHNLYLHSALVISRKIDTKNIRKVKEANFYYMLETGVALFVSFLINMFVLGVFAAGFTAVTAEFSAPCEDSYEAAAFDRANGTNPDAGVCSGGPNGKIDLAHAGCCLGERFNPTIKYIWAIGLLAAGQSSTMTGTYAGQFVMEGFLNIKIAPWKRVLITRSFAMIPTIAVALYAQPSTLGSLNEWMNVLQSIQLPFALVPLLHFTAMPMIMGELANGRIARWFGWSLSLVIIVINLQQTIGQWIGLAPLVLVPIIMAGMIYTGFVVYLMAAPFSMRTRMGGWYKGSVIYEDIVVGLDGKNGGPIPKTSIQYGTR